MGFIVLLNLSLLAEIQFDLDDMKLMADTWKCFMILTTKFAACLRANDDASLKWFEQSVEIICTHLQNIVSEFRRDPLDDKKLKIFIFFAKVLQKIFGDLSTQLHRANCYRYFIGMLRSYYEIKFVSHATCPTTDAFSLPINHNCSLFRMSHSGNNKISSLNEPLLAALRFIVGHKMTAELVLSGSSEGNNGVCIEIAKLLLKTTVHDHLYLDTVEARNLLHYMVFCCGAEG